MIFKRSTDALLALFGGFSVFFAFVALVSVLQTCHGLPVQPRPLKILTSRAGLSLGQVLTTGRRGPVAPTGALAETISIPAEASATSTTSVTGLRGRLSNKCCFLCPSASTRLNAICYKKTRTHLNSLGKPFGSS